MWLRLRSTKNLYDIYLQSLPPFQFFKSNIPPCCVNLELHALTSHVCDSLALSHSFSLRLLRSTFGSEITWAWVWSGVVSFSQCLPVSASTESIKQSLKHMSGVYSCHLQESLSWGALRLQGQLGHCLVLPCCILIKRRIFSFVNVSVSLVTF